MRLGYDINDKVKVSFTYRRLDSYFEYPTPYVDYNQWPSVPDPHLYNTEDKNRSNLVTGRVDAEISKLWSTSFMVGHYNMDYSCHTPGFDFQPNVMRNRRFQAEWRNALTWNKEWKTIAGMAWDRSRLHERKQLRCQG